MAMLTYTVTNVAILCCLAGLLGSISRRLLGDNGHRRPEPIFAGLTRGLVIYFMFLAGVFIAVNEPFANPTQDAYARLAGTLAVPAFLVGYVPHFFQRMIRAIINDNGEQNDDGSEPLAGKKQVPTSVTLQVGDGATGDSEPKLEVQTAQKGDSVRA